MTDIRERQSHRPFQEIRLLDQCKEVSPSTMPDLTDFRRQNKLSRNDFDTSTRKERSDCKSVSQSFEALKCFHKGVTPCT